MPAIVAPLPQFPDKNGAPLSGGSVYIGTANLNPATSPVAVYWDAEYTQPALQPLKTENGVIVRNGTAAQVYVSGDYSTLVQNASGQTVFYARNSTDFSVGQQVVDLRADLGSSAVGKGSRILAFIQRLTGAVSRWVEEKLSETVSVKDFGAVCDGVTDDSAAVQLAVNACLSSSRARALLVPGRCRLGSPVNIDRLVDTTSNRFVIYGAGLGAGFYTDTNVNMFDTTLPVTTDPQSENIEFKDIVFETSLPANNSFVLTGGKFLRVSFVGCEFLKIRCLTSTIYTQSYKFERCRVRDTLDRFFSSAGTYDFHAQIDGKFCATGFRFVDAARPVLESSISRCVWEGNTGSLIECTGAAGLTVSHNYSEFNAAPTCNFGAGSQVNKSISVVGNIFVQASAELANAAFYDVSWGATASATASGNYCNGKLHDASLITGSEYLLTISGDTADVELYKGFKTGIFDQNRVAVGNVQVTGGLRPHIAMGNGWVGIDPVFGGLNIGPGEVQNSAYVPIRIISGGQNPQTNNAFYGNPYWTVGSRVFNSIPSSGQPKGWICTVSGQPGTWISEGSL